MVPLILSGLKAIYIEKIGLQNQGYRFKFIKQSVANQLVELQQLSISAKDKPIFG